MNFYKACNRFFASELKVLKITCAQVVSSYLLVWEELKLVQGVKLSTLRADRILNTH